MTVAENRPGLCYTSVAMRSDATKPRDWIDYANLGSNLLQNAQLRDVQQKLGAISSIAAQAGAVAALEDKRREIIFEANTVLSEMRILAAENKAAVFALAEETLANLKRSGVTTANFRAYEDKERVDVLIQGYKSLAEEYGAALAPSERAEAAQCAEYLVERDELKSLVKARQRKHRLEQAETELRLLRKKSAPANFALILGGILFITGIAIEGVLTESEHATDTVTPLIGILTMIIGMVLGFIGKSSENTKRAEAYVKRVERLRRRVSDSEPFRSQEFSGKSAAELEKVLADRDALISKVLKSTKRTEN